MTAEQKQRRIAQLDTQINSIDDQMRSVRTSAGWSASNQAFRDQYLKQLDASRNDLRREKWSLEGR